MKLPVTLVFSSEAFGQMIRSELLQAINRLPLGTRFTVKDIGQALSMRRQDPIRSALDLFVDQRRLQRNGRMYWCDARIAVEPESETALKQQNMWNILRGSQSRPSVTPQMLALLASTNRLPVSEAEVQLYFNALIDGGYLQERGTGQYWLPPQQARVPKAPRLMQVSFFVDLTNMKARQALDAQEARP